MTTTENAGTVWVRTTPSVDGSTYTVVVEVDDDTAGTLTPESARAYASTLLTIVARAEYDAAVFLQLLALPNSDVRSAGQIIMDMRRDRLPVDDATTQPLIYRDGLSATSYEPFITISRDTAENRIGQWTVNDARRHALGVLEAVDVADLDAAYHRILTGFVGLHDDRARAVIGDLGKWRQP